jgi:hypothetical protein
MGIFRRKKSVFGETIQPNCRYCRYNAAQADDPQETVKCSNYEEGRESCRRYQYDPTKRVPKAAPKLGSFTPEDFSL